MFFYHLHYESPFCRTDNDELIWSETEQTINEDEYREELFDNYGYLINGWGEDDPSPEEYEDFIAEFSVEFSEISEEEFNNLADTMGYPIAKR